MTLVKAKAEKTLVPWNVYYIIKGKGPSEADLILASMSLVTKGASPLNGKRNLIFLAKYAEGGKERSQISITVKMTGVEEGHVIKGVAVNSEIFVNSIPAIPYGAHCQIIYNPIERSGEIRTFLEIDGVAPTKNAFDLITVSSCLSASNPAISISGCAPYDRVIVMLEDGSLQEVFRGGKFSQDDFEKKRGYKNHFGTNKPRIELADKMGCGKIAREIFGD